MTGARTGRPDGPSWNPRRARFVLARPSAACNLRYAGACSGVRRVRVPASFLVPGYGRCVFTCRYPRIRTGPLRGQYLHRAVWERIAGRAVRPGFVIHHMDGVLCWCPHRLVEMPPEFNAKHQPRDPYTGEFIPRDVYAARYGAPGRAGEEAEDLEDQDVPL